MNDILTAILKDTFTTTQLHYRLRILKDYLINSFFGGSKDSETYPVQDLHWLKSLPPAIYRQFSKDNVYRIFADLERQSEKREVLTIYLTFQPDDLTLARIGNFARKTFGLPVLLDTKFDPNLIAGCALVWKGVFKDYSLRTKIAEKKVEVLGSFKKFLR